jgi:2-dehydro-3-deoxyphosphooctonate aldolase (KDO 8-P synthase)
MSEKGESSPFYKKAMELLSKTHKNFGILVSSYEDISFFIEEGYEVPFFYVPGDVCRQTDILQRLLDAKRPAVIEKAPFLAPQDIPRILQKVETLEEVVFVDTGMSFGYAHSVWDPKCSVFFKKTEKLFGLHLSELLDASSHYEHKPSWVREHTLDYLEALLVASHHLGSSFIVIKESHLSSNEIQKIYDVLKGLLK